MEGDEQVTQHQHNQRYGFVSGHLTTQQTTFIAGMPCDRHPDALAVVKYLFAPQMELRILNNRMFKANRYSELYLCTLCEVLNGKEATAQSLLTIRPTHLRQTPPLAPSLRVV